MKYLNLDENGYLLSVSKTPIKGGIEIESLEGFDLSGHRIQAHRFDGEKLVQDEARLAELDAEEAAKAEELAAMLAAPTTDERIASLEDALAQTDEIAIELYEAQAEQEEINAAQDEALIEIYEMIGG